jgi:putative transposase
LESAISAPSSWRTVLSGNETLREKNRREGHEFHSCRFNLGKDRGFQPLRFALKPGRLISPPGTYFVTFSTAQRKRLFVVESYSRLFLQTLYRHRREGRYELHAFVLMPEHAHLLLTPAMDGTIERAVQLIKGAYSHELGGVIGRTREVWQRGFTDHRIRNEVDFIDHRNYIHRNPVERGMVNDPSEYRYCSGFPGFKLDSWPPAAEAARLKAS